MTKEEKIALLVGELEDIRCDNFDADTDEDKTLKEAVRVIKTLQQQPCEDEYIKVPKKALKYRTAGMVAYNVEWLKNHFDIERGVICGAQEPYEVETIKQSYNKGFEDCRQAVLDKKELVELEDGQTFYCISPEDVETLLPITPQLKTIQEKQAESEKYDKAFEDGYENGYAQARFDYEQEPKTDVLDNIRAEIEVIDTVKIKLDDIHIIKSPQRIKNEVLGIINKYKSESEGEE